MTIPTGSKEEMEGGPELPCGAKIAASESGSLLEGATCTQFSVRTRSILWIEKNEQYSYRMGAVPTPDGIVATYDQEGNQAFTGLDVVVGDVCYRASWPRTFSDRYLITLCRRYAAHMAALHGSAEGVAPQVSQPIREAPTLPSREELERALREARDLLLERIHGNPARSAGHNARLVIEDALKLVAPSPQGADHG